MAASLLDRVAELTPAKRRAWFKRLSDIAKRQIALGIAWWYEGRPEQQPPTGQWRWWLILAGRGWGKTRTGAEWCARMARKYPGARIALVAITFGDGRDTMVEGDSGLLSVLHLSELRGGAVEAAWNRSLGELFLANGSRFKIYSSERPRQLRGPQHHFAWGDEPAYWMDVNKGTAKDSTWSNLNIGLRLRGRRGWPADYQPRAVLTTTPRLVPLLKVPDQIAADQPHVAGLMQRPSRGAAGIVITRGTTMDNLDNLDETYRAAVVDPLIGTTLGRQELGGELLEEVEGALWIQSGIDRDRIEGVQRVINRRVLGFDPAGGEGFNHDEHGIVVAGQAGTYRDPEFFILADESRTGKPEEAARVAILAYYQWDCHAFVVEKNQGQDWLFTVLASVWNEMLAKGELPDGAVEPRWRPVTAVKDKEQRARPVSTLYEQKRVHHVGRFPLLEGQMTTWIPGDSDSPDRIDALVWAVTDLAENGPGIADVASPARRERRTRTGRRTGNQPSTRLPRVYDGRRSGR